MKRIIGILAIVLMVAVVAVAWQTNRTITLLDATQKPFKLYCDTTQAINDTVITFNEVKEIALSRIYQYIFQIDSVKSQSAETGETGGDSTLFRLKVRSRHTNLSNYFWTDICSVTTGSSGADTITLVVEKVMLAVGDTAIAPAANVGTVMQVVATIIDSTTTPIGTDTAKVVEVYGSVEVVARQ